MNINEVIFTHLIDNEGYGRKVIPFLKASYFQSRTDQTLFNIIEAFVHKYNKFPSREAILVEIEQASGLTEEDVRTLGATVNGLKPDATTSEEWLVEQTEKFCQDRALYNAIMKSKDMARQKRTRGRFLSYYQKRLPYLSTATLATTSWKTSLNAMIFTTAL